jgi:tRNA 2-thiouridine synthesizing protein A
MCKDVDSRLDVNGVCCPLPLIYIAKSVNNLEPGQTLEVIGNDPIFETTIRDFCQANGHAVVEVSTDENHSVTMLIRVGG